MKTDRERTNSLTQKHDRELADSVLEVSVKANMKVVEELRGDEGMCQALLEIMEPEINEIVDEAVDTATKDEAAKMAVNMLESGKFSVEEIHQYIPRLSIEEIRMLAKG